MKRNPRSIPEGKISGDKLQLINMAYVFPNRESFRRIVGKEKPLNILRIRNMLRVSAEENGFFSGAESPAS
jgi:hypothetical protein